MVQVKYIIKKIAVAEHSPANYLDLSLDQALVIL